MEFGSRKPDAWSCLGKGCGFTIPEEELLGPREIEKLIKEIKSEEQTEKIKE